MLDHQVIIDREELDRLRSSEVDLTRRLSLALEYLKTIASGRGYSRASLQAWIVSLSVPLSKEAAERVEAQPVGMGWVKAHALPSWLAGLFWIQFDDGTVGRHPASRDNGSWWYANNVREHAPIIAYCPAVPPPAPEPRQ